MLAPHKAPLRLVVHPQIISRSFRGYRANVGGGTLITQGAGAEESRLWFRCTVSRHNHTDRRTLRYDKSKMCLERRKMRAFKPSSEMLSCTRRLRWIQCRYLRAHGGMSHNKRIIVAAHQNNASKMFLNLLEIKYCILDRFLSLRHRLSVILLRSRRHSQQKKVVSNSYSSSAILLH